MPRSSSATARSTCARESALTRSAGTTCRACRTTILRSSGDSPPRSGAQSRSTPFLTTASPSDCGDRASIAHGRPRHRARDRRPKVKASLDPRVIADLPFANLETRRVVGDPAAVAGRPELRFGMNSGAASTPTVRPEGACRSRHLCRPSKRPGAVAVLTEQRPRRRRPGCSLRRRGAVQAASVHRTLLGGSSTPEGAVLVSMPT